MRSLIQSSAVCTAALRSEIAVMSIYPGLERDQSPPFSGNFGRISSRITPIAPLTGAVYSCGPRSLAALAKRARTSGLETTPLATRVCSNEMSTALVALPISSSRPRPYMWSLRIESSRNLRGKNPNTLTQVNIKWAAWPGRSVAGAGLPSIRLALEDAAVRGLDAGRLFTQDYPRHRIGPERGAALQVQVIGQIIDPLELVEWAIFRDVDGLRYRVVDEWLQRGLHVEMGFDRQVGGRDEPVRGRCRGAGRRAPQLKRIVGQQEFFRRAIFGQHFAPVGRGEDRLQSAGYVAGQETDRAGRRDRNQVTIADAVRLNSILYVFRQAPDKVALQIFIALEIREASFFLREFDGGPIGGVTNLAHHVRGDGQRAIAAVCEPEHDQSIGEPRDTKADAPRAMRVLSLLRKRKPRCVDHVVEQPHGDLRRLGKAAEIDPRPRCERRQHEACEIERTQIAGPIRRQWNLTAWVGGADLLAVPEIIELVDAVDEQYAGFGVFIRSTQNEVPELAGPDVSHHTAWHRAG